MSLFEATYREDLKSPWQFDDQICGNLCRCTGYRPIRDALHEVAGTRPDDQFKQVSQTYVDDNPEITYSNDGQTYHRPTTWDALWAALKIPDARLVSGSTDLGLHVTQKHIITLISLIWADWRHLNDWLRQTKCFLLVRGFLIRLRNLVVLSSARPR